METNFSDFFFFNQNSVVLTPENTSEILREIRKKLFNVAKMLAILSRLHFDKT